MLSVNFAPFPVLQTERLLLRQITAADSNTIFLLRSDPVVMKYLDRPVLQSKKEAEELVKKIVQALLANEGITWAIDTIEDGKMVGTIGFWRLMKEHYRAEIGYMLVPDAQGKGMMQEAMAAVIHYGFTTLQLHSIEANVNPGNAPSIQLLENNGFVREAYHKENYYYDGCFLDSAIYSLITPH